MFHNIQDGAIFIADAHYSKKRQKLKKLLIKIKQGDIKVSQLFLMGDIFDFLSAEIEYFNKINSEVIQLINEISKKIEVIYLEGNHDYNLKEIFHNALVIPREKQPIQFNYKNKIIALAHGDIFTPKLYNFYTLIIRNSTLLKILNFIDISNWLTSSIEKSLNKKEKNYKFLNFEEFAKDRIKKYEKIKSHIIIEGHFHQGKMYDKYINLPALLEGGYLQLLQGEFVVIRKML